MANGYFCFTRQHHCLFAAQKWLQLLQVTFKLFNTVRWQSHDSHGGISRTDAEKSTPGGNCIDSGDTRGVDGCWPRTRYRYTGSQFDR